ncbi:hypothetical protein Droror1_Dr00012691 [Drosera rotundifolia]
MLLQLRLRLRLLSSFTTLAALVRRRAQPRVDSLLEVEIFRAKQGFPNFRICGDWRRRPFSEEELRNNTPQVVTCNEYQREVAVSQNIAGKHIDRVFTFDKVFGPSLHGFWVYWFCCLRKER